MKKILLVDDEKGVVAMMKSYFEMSGYQVLTAYNGAEALRQAVHQPDIILLDINMPGMDGLTVCKKIRDYISCPILFLTARIETADKIKGFQVGADDYIIKPFDIDELGARVAAHLRRENRKQGQSELRFFSEMVIDYSKREVSINGERIGLRGKSLILWSFFPPMRDRSLTGSGFMNLCGGWTAMVTVIRSWSISEKYETSLLPCRVTAILKQFGGWATNGMDKKHEPEKVLVFSDVREPIAGSDPLRCRLLGLHKIKRGT